MIAKLIDGNLIYPTEYERQKIIITNPSDESLKFNMGYKDLIIDVEPEYDPETEYLEAYYEEDDIAIYKHLEVKPIPEPEENQIENSIEEIE